METASLLYGAVFLYLHNISLFIMANIGLMALVLIIVNSFLSYQGLKNREYLKVYSFNVDSILLNKDYKRLISSGFLHLSWAHLIFNMYTLFVFSVSMEMAIPGNAYLFIYFVSLVGGNLFALYIHRNHGDYSAVGASGAVCGVVFASIALVPDMHISLVLFPYAMPAWVYGLAYVLYTIYGIRSQRDNVGYEAHLGGALTGMLAAIALEPAVLQLNYPVILIITIPTLIFIYVVITRPHVLLIDNLFFKKNPRMQVVYIDHLFNYDKARFQEEVDLILEKVSKKGLKSLSKKERQMLEQHSRSL
jgi:membrane associated rhomboid family serine protease